MLRLMMCMVVCAASALALGGCRKAAEKTTEKVVKYTKEAAGGISEGYDKGRKAGAGADGIVIITSYPEIAPCGKIDIHVVYPFKDNKKTVVILFVENTQAKPMKLEDLRTPGNFLLIDSEGFAHALDTNLSPSDLTVLPNAKEKLYLYFEGDDVSKAKTLRVYGHDVPILAETIQKDFADDRP